MFIFFVCLVLVGISSVPATNDGVKLSKAQIRFSVELFQRIAAQDYTKDVVLSPYSVYSSLLTMLLSSAGDTRKLLHNVLRFDKLSPPSEDYISHSFLHELPSNKTLPYEFLSYDRIFDYLDSNATSDFKEDEVNNWIALFTKSAIKVLFGKGSIKKGDIFLMANVIHFNGTWVVPFKGGTSKKPFTLSDGSNVVTEFMSAKGTFKIMTDKELNAQVISLPYEGDRISMILIIPTSKPQKKKSPLEDVVKKLNYTKFEALTSTLHSQNLTNIELSMPKFELSIAQDLKPIFEALGDKDLFTKELYLPIYLSTNKVKVNQIAHKGEVKVYELGTEASAATGFVEARAGSATINANADHPFVFIIFDIKKRYIHSMGILNKPKKA